MTPSHGPWAAAPQVLQSLAFRCLELTDPPRETLGQILDLVVLVDVCRRWFQPIQENFSMESGCVFCPHCGAEVDQRVKRELNQRGRWVPEGCELTLEGELLGSPRETRIASFWMEGPAASDQTWQSLVSKLRAAEETFQATGNQKDLQSVTNVDWGRPYVNRTPGEKPRVKSSPRVSIHISAEPSCCAFS